MVCQHPNGSYIVFPMALGRRNRKKEKEPLVKPAALSLEKVKAKTVIQ
jgi:hypothetical protein